MLRLSAAGLLLGVAVFAAPNTTTAPVTFNKDVLPILQKNCQGCHRPGEIGPMSLLTYSEARPWAKAIKEEVLARRMPPWNAVKGFGKFKNDVGLTQEQIEVIADWVEGGAPEGNPAYLPPKPDPPGTKRAPPVAGSVKVANLLTLLQPSVFAAIQPGPLKPGAAVQVTAPCRTGPLSPCCGWRTSTPLTTSPASSPNR